MNQFLEILKNKKEIWSKSKDERNKLRGYDEEDAANLSTVELLDIEEVEKEEEIKW